jgi:hypothetical protein
MPPHLIPTLAFVLFGVIVVHGTFFIVMTLYNSGVRTMNDKSYGPDEVWLNGEVYLRRKVGDVSSTLRVAMQFPASENFNSYSHDFVENYYPGWRKVRATHAVMLEEDDDREDFLD